MRGIPVYTHSKKKYPTPSGKSLPKKNSWQAWTDGSLRRAREGDDTYGAWAYILQNPDGTVNHTKAAPVWDTTISRMELIAIIEVLQAILSLAEKDTKPLVTLYSDSQYALKSVLWWIPIWRNNDWKNAVGDPVKNKDLMVILSDLREKVSLTGWHVKAHNGNSNNEKADALCQGLTRQMESGKLKKPEETKKSA